MAAFPTGVTIDTANVTDAGDSPADARADIKSAFDQINGITNSYDSANGIAALDASGLIVNTKLPDSLQSSSGNNLTLNPNTGVVKINNLIELTPRSTAQLNALTVTQGAVAYCSDGNSGDACLAVYDGSNWVRVVFGATIST